MQAKKIFCILVAVCILLTAFPAAAFATDRCACGNDPVIVVPGYTSSSLYLHYDTPQEEQIWNLTAEEYTPRPTQICATTRKRDWKGLFRQLEHVGERIE
mgnify:CR=1 FL=1